MYSKEKLGDEPENIVSVIKKGEMKKDQGMNRNN
jgi:hypothetical protein